MTAPLQAVRALDRRVHGWIVTAAVTVLAAVLRLRGLGRPGVLVFDETYYVKDAWTLLHLGYEGRWPEDADAAFEEGRVDGFSDDPSYVVHPPVGKWVIAVGLRLLGAHEAAGWRLGPALAGIVAVMVLTRVARRLTGSTTLGGLAGLLLALDGAAVVHSRTGLLDGTLMLLLLAAAAALLVDRDRARARLVAATLPPRAARPWGPGLGVRPWRVLAGVLLGLAVGTKWSALWFVAVLGLLTVAWDATARRRTGARLWWLAAVVRDGPAAFVSTVGVGAVTYLASWSGWLRSDGGWGRHWAAEHPGAGPGWVPEPLLSLAQYHRQMWGFHTTLDAEHGYAAHPAGWLLQLRPTSFWFSSPEPALQACGADRCAQAVTSLGNPLVWWLGCVAVVACLWLVVRHRDGVALIGLAGVAAGWLPWFAYTHRTVFTFYAVVLLPWLILCLVHVTGRALRWSRSDPARHETVRGTVLMAVAAVIAVSVFFWPVWTAEVITFRSWQLRQWLPGWV